MINGLATNKNKKKNLFQFLPFHFAALSRMDFLSHKWAHNMGEYDYENFWSDPVSVVVVLVFVIIVIIGLAQCAYIYLRFDRDFRWIFVHECELHCKKNDNKKHRASIGHSI